MFDDSKEKSHPVGWLVLAFGFTCVLDSPVPSQPPVALAKQEHNNDDNKQTEHLAGFDDSLYGGGQRLVVPLMQIHLIMFPVGLSDGENSI